MTSRSEIAIVGTFDVENYGDLLFPLLARAELARRLPGIEVVAYSYNARASPDWPYEIRPVASLLQAANPIAGVLIGGGQLVRTDSYFPIAVPDGTIVPYDIWLYPAVTALALGVPLVWNAIGAWEGAIAFGAAERELFAAAVPASRYVGVRDAITADLFDELAGEPVTKLVPDSAFALRTLLPPGAPSSAYLDWRRTMGIDGTYTVIQATGHLASVQGDLAQVASALPDTTLVLLPICGVHGDRGSTAPFPPVAVVRDDHWYPPLLIAEIIANATLAIGSSLHFGITALCFGVPLLRLPGYADRKYEMLAEFAGARWLAPDVGRDAIATLRQQARNDPRVADYAKRVEEHWDRIAQIFAASERESVGAADRRRFAAWTTQVARRGISAKPIVDYQVNFRVR